jgi:hypothetical protein
MPHASYSPLIFSLFTTIMRNPGSAHGILFSLACAFQVGEASGGKEKGRFRIFDIQWRSWRWGFGGVEFSAFEQGR